MRYQDFDLLIDRSGEGLRAQVLNSPAGQATAEFRLPFSEDKLENYLLRLGRTRPATRRVESQEMNTAKAFGAALFDAVFSGDVKACFRSSIDEVRRHNAGLRIRLRLADPSVADLPWEFLYNRSVNRFIALSVHTPLVRYMDLPERIQPIAVKPPIRVLVMISSPSDFPALDVEAEWTRLNESLHTRVAAGQLAIDRLETASLEALQHRLRRERYHIFHFIGHGEFDQNLQEGVLILEGGNQRGHRVDSQFLGMLLHDHESLRIAILNACEGARTSRTDPFAGSAQSLVQQGIPAVIAMQFEIADDVASRFAHEFYGALADGYPIDASLTEARKSIFAAGREVEWGTPVLYLRAPDGRIFDIENTGVSALSSVRSSPRVLESSSRANQDRLADAIVAAANEAFAGGQRLEALEMLRRYDPARGPIGEALRKLTAEHERLTGEARRESREKIEAHLRRAGVLLSAGQLSEARARACDALQLDSTDKRAIALEARIRKALDDQAARDVAREQDEARERQREARRPGPRRLDENVRFTVYRPAVMQPVRKYPLLFFAHLAERRPDAPAGHPHPVTRMKEQVEALLGAAAGSFGHNVEDAGAAIPEDELIQILPSVEGLEFDPPSCSFRWKEDVHRAGFLVTAAEELEGRFARGSIEVRAGVIPVASITIAIPIERRAPWDERPATDLASPYRRIFASYSHRDRAIVGQFEQYARAMGDRYMRDVIDLRAGEIWHDRLVDMINGADVFQLFWSSNSMTSPFVRHEWEHALTVDKPHFVRPLYWESPFPEREGLPPPELKARHFANVCVSQLPVNSGEPKLISEVRDLAREPDGARRAREVGAREIERANALSRSRQAIEHSMSSGDVDTAEIELKRADESYDPGAEFADLRKHVVEMRREAELRQDRLADDAIERARREFPKTPAGAVELLERFTPPHPRVTAALRELQKLIAEQNEQAIREAERRGEEERERQRNKERRRLEMQQAVERIREYLEREELTEAAAALDAAEGTFSPASVFEELRARVKVAQRRQQRDDAARSAIGHGRNLAAAGDFDAALNLLEAFRPRHAEVDAAVEDLRRERSETTSRIRKVGLMVIHPRFLWAVAAICLLAAAALWIGPRALGKWGKPSGAPQPAATPVKRDVRPATTTVPPAAPPSSVGPATTSEPPAAAATAAANTEAAPGPTPPAPGLSPVKPRVPDEKIVATHRSRIQDSLTKKDPEQALARLTDALAYAPRDKGLRALGVRVANQAQDRAVQERSRAVAQGASGLAKFRQGDRAAQQARSLSRQGDSPASARMYLEAADLFASAAAESVKTRGAARPGARPNDNEPAAEAGPAPESSRPPASAPPKSEPPAVRAKPPASSVNSLIDALTAAIDRGDRSGVLTVYPSAPPELLAALGRRSSGYGVRLADSRIISDSRGEPEVIVTLAYPSPSASPPGQEKTQQFVLTLEPSGDSWKVVRSRPK